MDSLGYPRLAVTPAQVQAQAKMDAPCTSCHLGDSAAQAKDEAHIGLLRAFYVKNKKLEAATRNTLDTYKPAWIEPRGKNPVISLLPQVETDGKLVKDPDVQVLLYHDKNPDDLSFNYPALEKTCGSCHPRQMSELKHSAMGRNGKQSLYRTWTDTAMGPHNCGVWFLDNYREVAANTKVLFTKEMSAVNQKACNVCHVGCLDCHYAPQKADPEKPDQGQHSFSKQVSSLSCYGDGRGSICHAGPEDRRRGAGYIGGNFSNPTGATPDIHFLKGISCIDCHETQAKNSALAHGEVKRQVSCSKCHDQQVRVHEGSFHSNVSCEACHIRDVGAYTATFWGPGVVAGVKTPFMKYKEYYGVMKEPILIRNQAGTWIPVKPYPMAVLNQIHAGKLKPGLSWRFSKALPDLARTDDAYAFVGLLKGLPQNDNALAWIQMDKMSHKYGKARDCASCHTRNGEQRQEVSWKYNDQGSEPFEGKHVVTANRKGIFITGMQATTEIKPKEGWKTEDFAPWVYLKDAWNVKGNFAIPAVKSQSLYAGELARAEKLTATGGTYHSK
ncbi:MAG: cytochrome c3 family protein [Nitrospiraceae bacterium]|nr:cytochrome c3 family protein [Nitrospiraceae bacterium]